MYKRDLLFIAADNGYNPTTVSTDISHEFVPFLLYGTEIKKGTTSSTQDLR
jgi:phosphopentomutase